MTGPAAAPRVPGRGALQAEETRLQLLRAVGLQGLTAGGDCQVLTGQPLMLAAPVSMWPVYRRDHVLSVSAVTVKSYQPFCPATALK